MSGDRGRGMLVLGASFVCKFRSNIHFILWICEKCVRALAGTNMTTYRVELRVEFLSVICRSAFFYPSIFLPVQGTIGYSVYACLCHKYAEQEKGENGIPFKKEKEPNGSAKSSKQREM